MDPEYFESKFEDLTELDDAQERGRAFDYFIGLLFNQISGVDVMVGDEASSGEIDVFVSCLHAPEWLYRLVGSGTYIENKWRRNPTQTGDIDKFHAKVARATANCHLCYFISMAGYTSERRLGAEPLIHASDEPKMVGFHKHHVKQMVTDGTPANVLQEHTL